MTRSVLRLIVSVASAALLVIPAASGAAAANHGGTTTIVLFAENRNLSRIDDNQPGPDDGDLVHRELALSLTRGGPVIGVTYAQSEIVAFNRDAKVDIRRVDTQKKLPGGTLFTTGLSQLSIGTIPQPGWTDNYAVIGGTGKYAGARGTEKLTLLEDGKTFKVVITLVK